jgi:hypothetical protein
MPGTREPFWGSPNVTEGYFLLYIVMGWIRPPYAYGLLLMIACCGWLLAACGGSDVCGGCGRRRELRRLGRTLPLSKRGPGLQHVSDGLRACG